MKINWGTGTDMTRRVCGTAVAFLFLASSVPLAWSQQYYLYSPKPLAAEEKVQARDGVLVRDVPVQKGDTLFGLSRKFSGHGSYYPQILLFNDIKNPNLIHPGNVVKVPVSKEQSAGETGKVPAAVKKGAEQHAAASPKEQAAPVQKQPASVKPATDSTELSLSELKQVESGKQKKHGAKKKTTQCVKKRAKGEKRHAKQQAADKVAQKPATALHEERKAASSKKQAKPSSANAAAGQKLYEMAVKSYRQDDYRTALDLFDRFLAENPSSPLAADASLFKAECYMKLSNQ
jgi:TolA-binding protein